MQMQTTPSRVRTIMAGVGVLGASLVAVGLGATGETPEAFAQVGTVASSKCPSGFQVALDPSMTTYGSVDHGWERKNDLVNEQQSNNPWSSWEPGYDKPVTVNIGWGAGIEVDSLYLARDTGNGATGTIGVLTVAQNVPVNLGASADGWLPVPLTRATMWSISLTRLSSTSNISEVLVCAAKASVAQPTTTLAPTTLAPSTTAAVVTSTVAPTSTVFSQSTTTQLVTTTVVVPASSTIQTSALPLVEGVVGSLGKDLPPPQLPLSITYQNTQGYNGEQKELWRRLPDECSMEIHGRYWVQGPDGKVYPTWHPVKDPSGCYFGHDHGENPLNSPILWQRSQGLPFGFTNEQIPGMPRREDHVGHKVTATTFNVARGNVSQEGFPGYLRTSITKNPAVEDSGTDCQFLSKLHQGTHSHDAFANNLHEYFLNVDCTDGLSINIKLLAEFGRPNEFKSACNDQFQAPLETADLIGPRGSGAGGNREIMCQSMSSQPWELWVAGGDLKALNGGSVTFGSYYVVRNPIRVHEGTQMNPSSFRSVAKDAKASCPLALEKYNSELKGRADGGQENITVIRSDCRDHNFNGTDRGISFKQFAMYNDGGQEFFFTNVFGTEVSATKDAGHPVPQRAAKKKVVWFKDGGLNQGGSIDGSTRDANGILRANGQGSDHKADIPDSDHVHSPN
jgi:hypothetical protein